MDNLALGVTKAITELLESNERRSQEQRQRLSEMETKVDALEKTCTNLANENNKLREELTICKKQEEESRSIISHTADEFKELARWTHIITTIAQQLNDWKDQSTEANNRIAQLFEHIKQHQRHLKSIVNQLRQPPASNYTHRVTHVPRSLSSRFSNIEQSSSPLLESIDDEEISVLSDQTEHLKRGVDALNELQRSFEKNSLYYDDLGR